MHSLISHLLAVAPNPPHTTGSSSWDEARIVRGEMLCGDEAARSRQMKAIERTGPERGVKALLRRWRRRRGTVARHTATEQPSEPATVAFGAPAEAGRSPAPLPETPALAVGAYVTDGCSLMRIEHVHADRATGTTFVELEDCMTMELSVSTADRLAAQPLRSVVPVEALQCPPTAPQPRAGIRAHGGRAAAPQ